jgi:hypothetical protein
MVAENLNGNNDKNKKGADISDNTIVDGIFARMQEKGRLIPIAGASAALFGVAALAGCAPDKVQEQPADPSDEVNPESVKLPEDGVVRGEENSAPGEEEYVDQPPDSVAEEGQDINSELRKKFKLYVEDNERHLCEQMGWEFISIEFEEREPNTYDVITIYIDENGEKHAGVNDGWEIDPNNEYFIAWQKENYGDIDE